MCLVITQMFLCSHLQPRNAASHLVQYCILLYYYIELYYLKSVFGQRHFNICATFFVNHILIFYLFLSLPIVKCQVHSHCDVTGMYASYKNKETNYIESNILTRIRNVCVYD